MISRRRFLAASAAAVLYRPAWASTGTVLTAAPSRQQVAPEGYAETALWTFNGSMPGQSLRYRQGERLRIGVQNDLPQPTSVHWHGLRLPNAMDGVPGLTQEAIAPGDRFDYDFALPDAGTYWYHSHAQSVEQVERGLYGPLIVEEAEGAPDLDHDITLVLDDIRIDQDAQITADFDNRHDRSHAGRIGNLWIANGTMDPEFPVRQGQRLRLRLISAANARVFSLGLQGFEGIVVALDGMPLATPQAVTDRLTLAPAQRIDLLVDVIDETEALLLTFERDGGYVMAAFPVSGAAQARRGAPNPLPPNPEFPIDLAAARPATLLMEGGAMGGMGGAMFRGERRGMRELAMENVFWAFNGAVHQMGDYGHGDPLVEVAQGESVRIGLANDTAFPHAMHLHGMHFAEVLADASLGPLRDTILIQPNEVREIAFAAHNPGKWLFHCHMLSHHAAGMGTWINVV
ncbi:multicopper oxidase family protein [Thalassococcus sp. CAU 1522]|uniref:Multicopper oxidase family protein n=1 Tax=Thalassococcus arenae TaxID=2851652 RepID=A0ABS6N784_9RHOB|nr:multicopper oxidase family protein [Thalassococcus arenae]MBV2359871.1 multicopper oxidase family protein [Thalassococcus arenae]